MRRGVSLPGVLGEEGEVVEDGTQLGGVGGIDAGVVGDLGLDQRLNVGEVVADVPWAIAVGRSEVTKVDAELEVVPAVSPAQGVDVVELTLVIGGVVADVVVGGAVVEEEREDGGLRAVGGIGLEEIGGAGGRGSAERDGLDGGGALRVTDVEAEVVDQRRGEDVGGAGRDRVYVGNRAAVGGGCVEVKGAILGAVGRS